MNIKRSTLLGLTFMVCMAGWAQGPNNSGTYYAGANGYSGKTLKTKLYGIISSHTTISYSGLWDCYSTTDLTSGGYIWDMYSNTTRFDPDDDRAGNYSGEGDVYNREHSVPQSWFNSKSPMYSDLMQVIPTDGYVNNRRSNYPYGEVTSVKWSSNNAFSKLGTCMVNGSTITVFEPNDEYKGDLARIYFYMATAYQGSITSWSSSGGGTEIFTDDSYMPYVSWQMDMLLDWAKNDPVSEKEIARNNAVYRLQGNRNPFVDYPGLEDYIWGNNTGTALDYDGYINPFDESLQECGLAWSADAVTLTVGDEDYTLPTLSNPYNLSVTYSSSNTVVANVTSSGVVTVSTSAAGTATITATFIGNDTYRAGSASYTITVRSADDSGEEETGEYYFIETFDGNESTGGNDNSWSGGIASGSPVYDNSGWSLTAGYGAYQCIRLGTGSKKGSATTPTITGINGKTVTLKFRAAAWSSSSEEIELNLSGTGCTLSTETVEMARGEWTDYRVKVTGTSDAVTITFQAAHSSKNRFFLDEINIPKTVDAIDDVRVAESDEAIYNLQGVRMSGNLPRGIYIRGGKKILVR